MKLSRQELRVRKQHPVDSVAQHWFEGNQEEQSFVYGEKDWMALPMCPLGLKKRWGKQPGRAHGWVVQTESPELWLWQQPLRIPGIPPQHIHSLHQIILNPPRMAEFSPLHLSRSSDSSNSDMHNTLFQGTCLIVTQLAHDSETVTGTRGSSVGERAKDSLAPGPARIQYLI